ncbi:MAG: polyphosphate kinase 1 [Marinilabiliaceae bacterium]|nr:polyphosphate kinase 1 [Marinilabiliaceae bacterium]
MLTKPHKYIPKEFSWLAFNGRVLQEADKHDVPVIERLKFLGIYSNNLDEFFRVRVAILKRIASLGKHAQVEGGSAEEILVRIQDIVMQQSQEFTRVYNGIIKDLNAQNIYIISEKELNEEQGRYVRQFFLRYVRPRLMPLIITKERDLPDLKDEAIYLAVELISNKKRNTYALVEIPSNQVGRFIRLPNEGDKKYLILLDDVIRYELNDLFYMFEFDEIRAYVIKLTRDAELDLNDDISENYVKQIAQGLEKRKEAHPVRFVHDEDIPQPFLDLLLKKLGFSKGDAIIKGGRYHNFKDFMAFPDMESPKLVYPPLVQIPHPHIEYGVSIFSILKKRDLLINFPYHSFHHFIDVLREASIDPLVREIRMTIYRVAKQSNVMNALINAARNGKKVTAILELQARFDESANIKWSNRLKDEGVRVIYGVPGLKVHSKLCLISRNEKGKLVNYVGIGTGNFNEDSARVFSDCILLTRNPAITQETAWVFEFFDKNYKVPPYRHLLVSPFVLRKKIEQLINVEIRNAKAGKPAYIYLKLNNLVDNDMIQKLYTAHKNGVDVRLNVRGMMSLMPMHDPNLPPIPAIAIIDRYLEHSRLYIFGNGGAEKIYISSADLMARNLDRRVEVATPIYDPRLKQELRTMWDIQWADNCSARYMDNEMSNRMKQPVNELEYRSQDQFYKHLKLKSIES